MISNIHYSVLLVHIFFSAFGYGQDNTSERSSYNFNGSNLYSIGGSGRQYSSYDKLYHSSFFRNMGNLRRTKTRRQEHSLSMPDFVDEHPPMLEKPLMYNSDYKYRPMVTSHGYYYEPYTSYMNDLRIEGKEVLTAFGLGLTVGLGVLGLLAVLLKLFLGPLAFGSILSLLLVLAAPIPALTTGKMLLAALPKSKIVGKLGIQETLEEIVKRLPDLNVTPTRKASTIK